MSMDGKCFWRGSGGDMVVGVGLWVGRVGGGLEGFAGLQVFGWVVGWQVFPFEDY
jgi:hypothetical protein